ncbi:hypothetical protein B0T24DRAFT_210163 [Lasiosphaeria ovina]|uniref:Uncharacterized protein n=1 Tax=Lasiosphaeria ovina TaxID=92902 RepID=A0AAE0KGS8_9PEZI|nr:hypothetical protein B0T24DRAFT_210163 [Lasiosphaeria ovina]
MIGSGSVFRGGLWALGGRDPAAGQLGPPPVSVPRPDISSFPRKSKPPALFQVLACLSICRPVQAAAEPNESSSGLVHPGATCSHVVPICGTDRGEPRNECNDDQGGARTGGYGPTVAARRGLCANYANSVSDLALHYSPTSTDNRCLNAVTHHGNRVELSFGTHQYISRKEEEDEEMNEGEKSQCGCSSNTPYYSRCLSTLCTQMEVGLPPRSSCCRLRQSRRTQRVFRGRFGGLKGRHGLVSMCRGCRV